MPFDETIRLPVLVKSFAQLSATATAKDHFLGIAVPRSSTLARASARLMSSDEAAEFCTPLIDFD